MARRARYTASLPVYVVPEVRDRIREIAEDEEISQAEVVRVLIDVGLRDAGAIWGTTQA